MESIKNLHSVTKSLPHPLTNNGSQYTVYYSAANDPQVARRWRARWAAALEEKEERRSGALSSRNHHSAELRGRRYRRQALQRTLV
jgi:hypothetical protein